MDFQIGQSVDQQMRLGVRCEVIGSRIGCPDVSTSNDS